MSGKRSRVLFKQGVIGGEYSDLNPNRRNQRTTSVRLPPALAVEIDGRRYQPGMSMNRVVERDLSRYYYLLKIACAEASEVLTCEETGLIADALRGLNIDPSVMWTIPMIVARESQARRLNQKWDVDIVDLLGKLEHMPLRCYAALVDASERYWNRVEHGSREDPCTILDAVDPANILGEGDG